LPDLKNGIMLEEYEKKKQKQEATMRSLMDYARGVFFTGLGAVLFFHDKLNIPINDRIPATAVKALGVIFVLYGAWRFYRGIKKNYFQ
jgi:hypothetical protein